MERAIIYRRVSREEQRTNGNSLGFQDTDCVKWCQSRGYTILSNVEEVDTGDYLDERDGLWEVRQRMWHRDFDVLVVWKLDRLSRNQNNTAVILYEANKYGARVESTQEVIEDTPVGQFTRQAITFGAELERRNIIQRSVRGRQERVASGKPLPGRKAPYGYVWNETHTQLVPDATTAPIAQRIFHDVATGTPMREVARQLTSEGIPTPGGVAAWSQRQLALMLRNPAYWGKPMAMRWTMRKTRTVDALTGRGVVRKAVMPHHQQPIPLPADVAPALVTEEVAMAAHRTIDARRTRPQGKNKAPEKYLLRGGYAYCGDCDKPMVSRLRYGHRPHYMCSGGCFLSVSGRKLDAHVWERVENTLRHPAMLHALVDTYQRENENPAALRRDALTAELRTLEKEKENLRRRIRQTGDNELQVMYEHDLKDVLAHERSLQKDITEAEAEYVNWEHVRDSINRLVVLCQDVDSQANGEWTYDDKRLVLHILGVRATVWRKGHTPRWQVHALPFGNRPPVEKNSTIIFPLPIDLVEPLTELMRRGAGANGSNGAAKPIAAPQQQTPPALPQG